MPSLEAVPDTVTKLRSLLSAIFGRRRATSSASNPPDTGATSQSAPAAGQAAASSPGEIPAAIPIAGTQPNWLRVLPAADLLASVQADKALREIWRQTRLSKMVWERDGLLAIHRYAEFVQLMPASESHHHAHAGGLLAHTIEMLLAAMTWRNGRLLPEASPIEVIDAQRDEWTFVVFYSALLHDIAKPMTDLRITWRAKDMAEPVRWMPMAGSLCEIAQGRAQAEYLVEFAPKVERDYLAHSRTAMQLLAGIVPPTALAFLAREPRAFEALNKYLSGADRDSLVAEIVREADKASARRALLSGSKARFATAKAVPLVDLMMQSLQAMLRSGTTLPLNRSGAAGWVYDGSVWFVAKRVADATREWIRKHEPDEAVPNETKNDRLFDTWQEYGCIQTNPQSGQAVWYVTVHGAGGSAEEADAGSNSENLAQQGAYTHSLTMLRFPLAKLFADPAHYPPPMRGRIEVLVKRKAGDEAGENAQDGPALRIVEQGAEQDLKQPPAQETEAGSSGESEEQGTAVRREPAAGLEPPSEAAPVAGFDQSREAAPIDHAKRKPKPRQDEAAPIKAPAFNKPKNAAKPKGSQAMATSVIAPMASHPKGAKPQVFGADEADYLLDAYEMASDVVPRPARKKAEPAVTQQGAAAVTTPAPAAAHAPAPAPTQMLSPMNLLMTGARAVPAATGVPSDAERTGRRSLLASRSSSSASALNKPAGGPKPLLMPGPPPRVAARAEIRSVGRDASGSGVAESAADPAPVILQPKLPKIPGSASGKPLAQPTPQALEFLRWIQHSLASRELKYNETGAVVHFVPEGMALVSPLIFKLYAATLVPEAEIGDTAVQIQREVIKAGWHMGGPNRTNIVRYSVIGRGDAVISRLAAVVLVDPGRWVQPVPPSNPVLKIA